MMKFYWPDHHQLPAPWWKFTGLTMTIYRPDDKYLHSEYAVTVNSCVAYRCDYQLSYITTANVSHHSMSHQIHTVHIPNVHNRTIHITINTLYHHIYIKHTSISYSIKNFPESLDIWDTHNNTINLSYISFKTSTPVQLYNTASPRKGVGNILVVIFERIFSSFIAFLMTSVAS
jgi:hypothetical protein